MTVHEIAARLAELCKTGQFEQAQNELYADNCVSIEGEGSMVPRVEGLDAIREKGRQFQSMIDEYYGGYVTDPVIAGNHITLTMGMDVKMRGQERFMMEEVCVYKVQDGKIVLEHFFF
ncbi:MAG: hypothetical protein L6Q59_02885 [Ignavibacteriaceae bacterium]|nr:hypothetical protein [Ignavibacteriaceae bacterium]